MAEPSAMTLSDLEHLITQSKGESENTEFKRSTADLQGGMETLCGFLNGTDGRALFGVANDGRILGQDISDATLREVANAIRKLEPSAWIEPGLFEREDQPIFPPMALREVLVNALCHRDYAVPGGAVSVAVFDDRLEISSTGLLPQGITIDDLKREHNSRPRNPTLAELFYRRGLVERWGRGTVTRFPRKGWVCRTVRGG